MAPPSRQRRRLRCRLPGNGSLALSGGAFVSVNSGDGTSASIVLGRSAGATGTITLTGANTTLTTDGGVNVGDTGTGSIGVSGGAGFSATSAPALRPEPPSPWAVRTAARAP